MCDNTSRTPDHTPAVGSNDSTVVVPRTEDLTDTHVVKRDLIYPNKYGGWSVLSTGCPALSYTFCFVCLHRPVCIFKSAQLPLLTLPAMLFLIGYWIVNHVLGRLSKAAQHGIFTIQDRWDSSSIRSIKIIILTAQTWVFGQKQTVWTNQTMPHIVEWDISGPESSFKSSSV